MTQNKISIRLNRNELPKNPEEVIHMDGFIEYFKKYIKNDLMQSIDFDNFNKKFQLFFIKDLGDKYALILDKIIKKQEVTLNETTQLYNIIKSAYTKNQEINISISGGVTKDIFDIIDLEKIKNKILDIIGDKIQILQKNKLQQTLLIEHNIDIDISNPLQKYNLISIDRSDGANFYEDKLGSLIFILLDKNNNILQLEKFLNNGSIKFNNIYNNLVIDIGNNQKIILVKEGEKYKKYFAKKDDFYFLRYDSIFKNDLNYKIIKENFSEDFNLTPFFAIIYQGENKYMLDIVSNKKIPIIKKTAETFPLSKKFFYKFELEYGARGNTIPIYILPVEDKNGIYFLKYNKNGINTKIDI